jgi:O-antigen/teichoic acid export membrane protein
LRSNLHLYNVKGRRTQRIVMAVTTSLLSKGATIILQLAITPIAIRKLGVDLYGVYAILTSFLLLISMSEFGIGPRLIRRLSMAEVRADRRTQQIAFSSAFLTVTSIGIAAAAVLSITAQIVPAAWIAGVAQQAYVSTIRQCVPVVSVLGLVQLLSNVVQRAQAGFQELHVYNIAGALGNVFMIVGIAMFSWLHTSVLSLTLCLYGTQSVALLGNMAVFVWRRPWITPRLSSVSFPEVRSFLQEGIHISLNQSIVPWIQREFTKILLFRLAGPGIAAQFAICLQLATLLGGLIAMFTTPFYGAISDAVSRQEFGWVQSSFHRSLATTVAYCAIWLVILPSYGRDLLVVWLGPQADVRPEELFAFALYFAITALKHIMYVFIVSIRYASLITVMSFVEALFGVLWIFHYGALGVASVFFALALINFPSAFIVLPRLCRSTIKANALITQL